MHAKISSHSVGSALHPTSSCFTNNYSCPSGKINKKTNKLYRHFWICCSILPSSCTLQVVASEQHWINQCIGVVLPQDQRPVAYGSQANETISNETKRNARSEHHSSKFKNIVHVLTADSAIVFRCETFHQYVYGREVQVESDHKLLESIFKELLHQKTLIVAEDAPLI